MYWTLESGTAVQWMVLLLKATEARRVTVDSLLETISTLDTELYGLVAAQNFSRKRPPREPLRI